MKNSDFFLEENNFKFIDHVRGGETPWSILNSIHSVISEFLKDKEDSVTDEFIEFCQPNILTISDAVADECSITVGRTLVVTGNIYLNHAGVFIGGGTKLEAGAIIKGPAVIGRMCEIRQGAYIRGNVIVGDNCVVGHVTEVKNSIFMDHTNAGHFNYVGDSILGSHVNLGAGVKLANLRFRTKEEIDAGSIKEIMINDNGRMVNTGLKKFGAIIGDYSEIGCNAVTSPGTLIGAKCWVHPNITVSKGFYTPGSVLKNAAPGI